MALDDQGLILDASRGNMQAFEEDIERGEIRATYILNGGGERIRLETANGNIYIRELIDRQ